jgi:IclR family transcriptional regulator, KDG regulon repressor
MVELALGILEKLAESEGMSDTELEQALKAEHARVAGILETLTTQSFIVKDAVNLYWLGPQLLYLGSQASARSSLLRASGDILDNLMVSSRCTCALIVRDQLEVLRVAFRTSSIATSPQALPPFVASRGPLHTGGAAKLLLAYAPQDIIDRVIVGHLGEFIPSTLRTREGVLEHLEQTRRNGYYIAIGERHPEVFTICAPVLDGRGSAVAALGLMGLIGDLTPGRQDVLIESVIESAQELSNRLC